MRDLFTLPLREWKRIAYASGNAEFINYLGQWSVPDHDELFILHPVEHEYSTDEQVAIQDEESRLEARRVHWEERKAIEANLPVMGM